MPYNTATGGAAHLGQNLLALIGELAWGERAWPGLAVEDVKADGRLPVTLPHGLLLFEVVAAAAAIGDGDAVGLWYGWGE